MPRCKRKPWDLQISHCWMPYWVTSLKNITIKSMLDTSEFTLSVCSRMFQPTPFSLGKIVSKTLDTGSEIDLLSSHFFLWFWERTSVWERETESKREGHHHMIAGSVLLEGSQTFPAWTLLWGLSALYVPAP